MKVANFVQADVLRDVTTHGLSADLPVTAAQVAELLALVDRKVISGKQAKEVYAAIVKTDRMPAELVKERGMTQVTDPAQLEAIVERLAAANPKQVEGLRSGKTNLKGFFVGQVMKETRGSANPQAVNDAVDKVLGLA